MSIYFHGDTPDDVSIVFGIDNDKIHSCISYKANQLEPSQLLRIVFKNRGNLNVVSNFDLNLV